MELGRIVAEKYRLTRQIGRGGMGSVFEAAHVMTGDRVALKVMAPSQGVGEDETLRMARFEREALAVGRLDTPHVVQVYDAGIDRTTSAPFIAMELLDGEDLSQMLKRLGPLRVELAVAIVAQACAGLAKAHEAGIIHRDIKPGNLFIHRMPSGDYVVKVLDFGIAKVTKGGDSISSELGTITATGTLMGSPYYMSPEQAKGLKTMDHRADLWSLGVVLYKCLCGRTPFDGVNTLGQVILAVCSDEPIRVEREAPWVPPSVIEVLGRALQRPPAMRFQSALEMRAALSALFPEGARITPEMFAPLPHEHRALAGASFAPPESTPGLGGQRALPAARSPGMQNAPMGDLSRASFTSSRMPTAVTAPSRRRGVGTAIAAFVALAVIGVFLILYAARRAPAVAAASTAPTGSTVTSARTASSELASTTPSPASSASALSSAAVSPPTTVAVASVAPPPTSTSASTSPSKKPRAGAQGRPSSRPPATTASSGTSAPGRLQGGVGSDVPF